MSWRKLDDRWATHPKVRGLIARHGIDAWVWLGWWAIQWAESRDGFVDAATALYRESCDPEKVAPMLVEAGLLEPVAPGRWYFHDWHVYQLGSGGKYQPTKGGKARATSAKRDSKGHFLPSTQRSPSAPVPPSTTQRKPSAPAQRSPSAEPSASRTNGPALPSAGPAPVPSSTVSTSDEVEDGRAGLASPDARAASPAPTGGFRAAMAAAGFDPFWEDRPSREPSPGEDDVLLAASFPEEDPYGDP